MLDMTPRPAANAQLIESYGGGSFIIGNQTYANAVIVFPEQTLSWEITKPDEITPESLAIITRHIPPVEILLIGSGAAQTFLPLSFRKHFSEHGIAVECMDTGAACRTFNILLSEQRRAAAALIPV